MNRIELSRITASARALWTAALAVAVTAAAGFAGSANALVFSEVPTLETIASRAPLAFRGVVETVEHANAKTAHGSYPYTVTTFRVLKSYRGTSAGAEIAIARLGGPVDGDMRRYLVIPGVPGFSPGDEVVVFQDDGEHPFFGASYGDHGVLRVAHVGGERAMLNFHGQPLVKGRGRFRADGSITCKLLEHDRGACTVEQHATDESADEDEVSEPTVQVTPADFDRTIDLIVAANPLSKPALTVSGDPAAFEAALSDLALRAGAR